VHADDQHGSADWVARYTFSATKRHVTNRIHASLQFRDELIHRHIDHFLLYAWSEQALGPVGLLLGCRHCCNRACDGRPRHHSSSGSPSGSTVYA